MLGYGHDFLDFLDACKDSAEGNEFGTGQTRNEASKRGFPAAGRPPEEHGAKVVILDLNAKRLAGTEQFFLANKFIEGARTHALGERLIGGGNVGFRGRWRQFRKEAHVILDVRAASGGLGGCEGAEVWMPEAGEEFLWRAAS